MEKQRFLVELTSANGDTLDADDVAEAVARMVYQREAQITVEVEPVQGIALNSHRRIQ